MHICTTHYQGLAARTWKRKPAPDDIQEEDGGMGQDLKEESEKKKTCVAATPKFNVQWDKCKSLCRIYAVYPIDKHQRVRKSVTDLIDDKMVQALLSIHQDIKVSIKKKNFPHFFPNLRTLVIEGEWCGKKTMLDSLNSQRMQKKH